MKVFRLLRQGAEVERWPRLRADVACWDSSPEKILGEIRMDVAVVGVLGIKGVNCCAEGLIQHMLSLPLEF